MYRYMVPLLGMALAALVLLSGCPQAQRPKETVPTQQGRTAAPTLPPQGARLPETGRSQPQGPGVYTQVAPPREPPWERREREEKEREAQRLTWLRNKWTPPLGMTAAEVYQVLGCPDYIQEFHRGFELSEHVWYYNDLQLIFKKHYSSFYPWNATLKEANRWGEQDLPFTESRRNEEEEFLRSSPANIPWESRTTNTGQWWPDIGRTTAEELRAHWGPPDTVQEFHRKPKRRSAGGGPPLPDDKWNIIVPQSEYIWYYGRWQIVIRYGAVGDWIIAEMNRW